MTVPRLYADPALYDKIHAEGTDDEVWLLDWIAKERGLGKTALEPACGTGRYMAGLLRRGWRVTGYDSSAKMVAYARGRLQKYGDRARVLKGDMRTFKAEESFDLAFNLLSTFRHLLTDEDALAHLNGTAAALKPRGLFVLGLDLADYGRDEEDEEVWKAGRVKHVVMTVPGDRTSRRERVINFVHEPGRRVLESAYDLRTYDSDEIAALIERSRLRLERCLDYSGKPAALGGPERALWLLLRER